MRSRFASPLVLAALAFAPNEAGHGAAPPAGAQPSAGGAQPPAPSAASPPPAPAPAANGPSEDEIRAKAEADLLKKLGVKDAKEIESVLKSHRDAEAARMTEAEKTKKALDEAMNARGDAEAKADKHASRVKELEAQIELRDKLDANGVAPKERIVAEALLKAEKQIKGKDFDEAKFFEQLRTERPYLFGSAQAPAQQQGATTGPTPPAPAGGAYGGNGNSSWDAMLADPKDVIARRSQFS